MVSSQVRVDGGLVSAGSLYISNHQMVKYRYTGVGQFLEEPWIQFPMIFKGSLQVQFWIFLFSKTKTRFQFRF
jgi:hypothetical protein